MKSKDTFNNFWKLLHLFAMIALFVVMIAFSHPVDIHIPTGEDLVEEHNRKSDPPARPVVDERGNPTGNIYWDT
jgi:hypothetical protein